MLSETKISASPMMIRPPCRQVLSRLRKNSVTPASSSSGTSQSARNSNNCTTSAEPTSAPSTIASATEAVIVPAAMNEVASIATAVELCNSTATPAPASAASAGRPAPSRSQRRSGTEKARSTPVRTSRTDQINSAAAPAMCTRKRTTPGFSTLPPVLPGRMMRARSAESDHLQAFGAKSPCPPKSAPPHTPPPLYFAPASPDH